MYKKKSNWFKFKICFKINYLVYSWNKEYKYLIYYKYFQHFGVCNIIVCNMKTSLYNNSSKCQFFVTPLYISIGTCNSGTAAVATATANSTALFMNPLLNYCHLTFLSHEHVFMPWSLEYHYTSHTVLVNSSSAVIAV